MKTTSVPNSQTTLDCEKKNRIKSQTHNACETNPISAPEQARVSCAPRRSRLDNRHKKNPLRRGDLTPFLFNDTYLDPSQFFFPAPFLVRTRRQENLDSL